MSKYKIGDKVRIKSIEWYNQNKDSFGLVLSDNDTNVFCYNMQLILTIISAGVYAAISVKGKGNVWHWSGHRKGEKGK